MAEQRSDSCGGNARPLEETIAGTGRGIPDDALAPGEDLLEALRDEKDIADAKAVGPLGRREGRP